MKQKFWQTKEFIELEKEWYTKLEKSHFEDVEKQINGNGVLKQRASNCYRSIHQIERENKQRYYELLAQAVHNELEFRDSVERFIMERKSVGTTINQISIELEQVGERCYRGTIRKIIQKYERKWLIKRP